MTTNTRCWLWLFLALGMFSLAVLTIGVVRSGVLC